MGAGQGLTASLVPTESSWSSRSRSLLLVYQNPSSVSQLGLAGVGTVMWEKMGRQMWEGLERVWVSCWRWQEA